MKCLDRFNSKMNRSGGSLRNENIQNSKILLEETFSDDASFMLGVYFWKLGKLGIKSYENEDSIKIRFYDRKYSSANGNTVKFQTLFDTPIDVGDIIYSSKSDEYFICTESFNINDIHWQGKLTLCNWILRWQNKNGDILEYPCYNINATQYNSGETPNRLMTVGSSQHIILLPCDENTVILESPQRFVLDKNKINPTTFIVTQNDTASYNYGKKGIARITVAECANNNDTDRFDLGICDYIDKNKIIADNSDNLFISKSVISYDTSIIKSGGDSQLFIGKFYDNNGNEITDILPKWEIICDFKNILEIEQSDNKISISIDNDDYIDEEFKLVLSDINGNYTSSVIVKIESLL